MNGSLNPCPYRIGGGPTPSSKAYATIRQAVGKGGSAENELGIDGLWRRSRAKGLAAATSPTRRALLQAWPQVATDAIPYFERVLGIVPGVDDTEPQRRAVIVPRWTETPIRTWSELRAALQAIYAGFDMVVQDDSKSTVTLSGRAFDSHALDPAVGPPMSIPGGCTEWPAYSTRRTIRVTMALGAGTAPIPTPTELAYIEQAKTLFRRALPAHVDFQISTGRWVLGSSPLGFVELG